MSGLVGAVAGLPLEQQKLQEKCFHPTGTFISFPKEDIERSVPERFERIVRQYPDRLAVKTRHHALTFTALNHAANRVAWAILERYEAGQEPVALLLEQGAPAIATLFGVLKTGKFYVTLDPTFPHTRLAAILEDTQPRVLVTDNRRYALARTLADDRCDVLNIDTFQDNSAIENPDLHITPDAFAYILYTSGSTGKPKGVIQNHRNILHQCMNNTNRLHVCADDRATLFASLTTSQAMSDIYRMLLNGAELYPLHLKQEGLTDMADWLMQEQITIYRASATVFRAFVDTLTGRESFPALRLVILGSEPVCKRDVERYREHFASTTLFVNQISSTEAYTFRMYVLSQATPINGNVVPVGYPVEGKEVILRDENDEPVEAGQTGEIVISSRYLSPGYWRQPELTQAAFLSVAEAEGVRLYRTGDLGRLSPDGCLEHLGRRDLQVKIRGHRVEVTEVEEVLRDHAAVKQAVVMARQSRSGDPYLVAYCVPAAGSMPGTGALRDTVLQRLPDYMVPSAFVRLDTLPLTPSGKVDRLKLPAPDRARPQLRQPYIAPRTPIETQLAGIWAEVLGFDQIGIQDNVFDLGGHSLLLVRLLVGMEQGMGRRLPLQVLLQAPTVEQLAQAFHAGAAPAAGIPRSSDVSGREITFWHGLFIRALQLLALYSPGLRTTRVWLHRLRGVKIGRQVSIGTGAIIETAFPRLVAIGNNVSLGIRSVIIAHFREMADQALLHNEPSVRIEDDVYIGPGVVVLPNVTIGQGAVVTAGSVVSKSVSPRTMVQGNPAQAVAHCEIPLVRNSYGEFLQHVKPIASPSVPEHFWPVL